MDTAPLPPQATSGFPPSSDPGAAARRRQFLSIPPHPALAPFRNEQMFDIIEAIRSNNFDAMDGLIARFLEVGGPRCSIHSLSQVVHGSIQVDKAPAVAKLLDHGTEMHHSFFKTALEARAMRCLDLFVQRGYDINEPEGATKPPAWSWLCLIRPDLIRTNPNKGESKDDASRELVDWLLAHGANLNVHGRADNSTPMSYAVQYSPLVMVQRLFDFNDVNDPSRNVDVCTGDLLHHALDRKGPLSADILPILAMLVSHGAPINEAQFARHIASQNMYFFMPRGPPLHKAADMGQLDAVQFLLSRHADTTIRDTKGKTALFYAQKKGHTAVAEVLQAAMAEQKAQHL